MSASRTNSTAKPDCDVVVDRTAFTLSEHMSVPRALSAVKSSISAVFCAILLLTVAPAEAQTPGQGASPAEAGPAEIRVQIVISESDISAQEILAALKEEFGVEVRASDESAPLRLVLKGRNLTATFDSEDGEVVHRRLLLPEAPEQQADAVALLAGNLARDEAAVLLAQLTRAQELKAAEDARLAKEEDLQREAEEKLAAEEAVRTAQVEKEKQAPLKTKQEQQEPEAQAKEPKVPEKPDIPAVPYSLTLSGDLGTPANLSSQQTHFGLGLIYKDVGGVDGFAASLLTLRNRGLTNRGAGRGAQMSLIWLGSDNGFKGFSGSAIAVTERGGTRGVQAGGILALQEGDIHGTQLSLVGSVAKGRIKGSQVSLVAALAGDDVKGVQASGLTSVSQGNVEGVQVAALASYTGGRLDGFQLGLATVVGELDGMQVGAFNAALDGSTGSQFGVVNYSGGSSGSQIGLINIGGEVKGSQFGLLNIARDVDGLAVAPVNIIPGLRTQLLGYASYSPQGNVEGVPDLFMYNAGIRVRSHAFYSELGLGLGAEAKDCSQATEPSQCDSGGVEYSPALAFGGRFAPTKKLFFDMDLQYRFEKAFSSSNVHQHAVLGRASLGYQASKYVAPYVGGGPRINVRDGDGVTPSPAVSWSPHFFAGVQFF